MIVEPRFKHADKAEMAAGAIRANGGEAGSLQLDVRFEDSARAAVEKAIATFGKLTTLVNVAAAVMPDGNAETLSLDLWENAIRVNAAIGGSTNALVHLTAGARRLGVDIEREEFGNSETAGIEQLEHGGVAQRQPWRRFLVRRQSQRHS